MSEYSKTQDKSFCFKNPSESNTEEKRREEKSYLNNINNINNEHQEENVKTVRTIYISRVLWDSAKKYAFHMECSASSLVEKSLMEYMVKHATELPMNVSFNLVPIQLNVCEVKGCNAVAVGSAVYLPRNEELKVCKFHLVDAKRDVKRWKVLP